MKAKTYPHISIDPAVCGGAPRVAGTRITVAHIAEAVEHLGMTPDDVVAMYRSLNGQSPCGAELLSRHRRS
jgi:uncharacterized protein (DUF433 family)